ncbi:MAG: glutamine-hydrolyzing GMP synthase, partial [Candidatus Eutrophobiaceae bacterium]
MTARLREQVLILDFGSQYTRLIARRVRELGVYSEILPWDAEFEKIQDFQPQALILSGGPESVVSESARCVAAGIFDMGIPILGICYGMHAMAQQLGGQVNASAKREFGHAQVRMRGHSELLRGVQDQINDQGHGLLDTWMSHGDSVEALPPSFKCIASTETCPLAGMADERRKLYGLQFHPEVVHTKQGGEILRRFLCVISGCAGDWSPGYAIEQALARIRSQVGDGRVLLALSGGVDSSVACALLSKAIGKQLHCVFVDTGLLRMDEGDRLMQVFAEDMGVEVERVNAAGRFFTALRGETDPERKRRIIGREFVEVFQERAALLKDCKWLAQGTIYPDVIESSNTGNAAAIKAHHNVGGLPEDMSMKLLEPLRELFKDEVRKVGMELGLPKRIICRHPFPGPGLGVRVLGEVRPEYVELLRHADWIFTEELERQGLYDEVAQAFAVYLPVKSVGVVGDARAYEPVIALRAVQTVDFMTAHWAQLPWDFLAGVSNRIVNEVGGISRVVYDISGKPPATIEWE